MCLGGGAGLKKGGSEGRHLQHSGALQFFDSILEFADPPAKMLVFGVKPCDLGLDFAKPLISRIGDHEAFPA